MYENVLFPKLAPTPTLVLGLQGGRDGGGDRGGRTADEATQVAAGVGQLAASDGLVDVDEAIGEVGGHARAHHKLAVLLAGQARVRDVLAGLPGHLRRVLSEAPGDIAAQLLHRTLVALAGEDGGRGGRVVGAGGGGDVALAVAA